MSTQRQKSAPVRSSLLMKQMRGTEYLSAWRQTVSDWGSTPATPSKTTTAPSSTRRLRSTSTVKSTCPGVSMMLMLVVVPEAGRGRGGDGDAALLLLRHPVHRGRALMDLAELVDLLRVEEDPLGHGRLARVDVGDDPDVPGLRERDLACHGSIAVPDYHLKWLKALLASAILWVSSRRLTAAPRPFDRVHELGRELLAHALAAALAGGLDEPAHAERQAAIAADLDRDLVGGATDAARLDLDDRGRVAQRGLHDLEAGPARGRLGAGERLAQDALGEAALAVAHELGVEADGGAVDGRLLVLGLAGDPGAARHLALSRRRPGRPSRRTCCDPACGRARRRRRGCRG